MASEKTIRQMVEEAAKAIPSRKETFYFNYEIPSVSRPTTIELNSRIEDTISDIPQFDGFSFRPDYGNFHFKDIKLEFDVPETADGVSLDKIEELSGINNVYDFINYTPFTEETSLPNLNLTVGDLKDTKIEDTLIKDLQSFNLLVDTAAQTSDISLSEKIRDNDKLNLEDQNRPREYNLNVQVPGDTNVNLANLNYESLLEYFGKPSDTNLSDVPKTDSIPKPLQEIYDVFNKNLYTHRLEYGQAINTSVSSDFFKLDTIAKEDTFFNNINFNDIRNTKPLEVIVVNVPDVNVKVT